VGRLDAVVVARYTSVMRLAWLPVVCTFALSACHAPTPAQSPRAEDVDELDGATFRTPEGASDLRSFQQRAQQSALICVGEQHDDAQHHDAQNAVLRHLIATGGGRQLALGLEMVQRPWQAALDDYSSGRLDDQRLAEAVDWDRRWGYDFAMYQPMLHAAHEHGVRLLALNAPRELTRAIARHGLESLPDPVRESLPELDADDAGHRRFFLAAMGFDPSASPHGSPHHGHGKGHAGSGADRFYLAQVLWDETMAEGAAAWLDAPTRQVMVVAGNGHCHQSAIPSRVARRRPEATTLSVLLQTGDGPLPEHATSDFVIRLPAKKD
jgi:uncharacterized iron-regulated protein